jgi:CubicO group peptidase (beta-lactamase class C family)
MKESIDALLRDAANHGAIPGAVVSVAGVDGMLCESVAGAVPSATSTVFRIASMTKAVASVAALQLVECGRLDLDAEVSSVIPAFGDLPVLESFDGDRPRLRAPARQATVRQLLNHTAGHGYWFTNALLKRYHEVAGLPSVLEGTLAGLHAPLVADPGTRWEYGINTDWLGRVVEEVSGQTLDAYLAANVFEPLGMRDATFAPDGQQRSRLMPISARSACGAFRPGELDLPAAPEFCAAGHGLFATARDYTRFMRALLRGGELDGVRILQADTVELMFRDSLDGIALPEMMHTTAPELSNDVPSAPFRQGWGLGLHLTLEDVPGMRGAGTGDWAGLFNSFYWIDRRAGIAAVMLTQVLPFFDHGVVETLLALEATVYSQRARAPS